MTHGKLCPIVEKLLEDTHSRKKKNENEYNFETLL